MGNFFWVLLIFQEELFTEYVGTCTYCAYSGTSLSGLSIFRTQYKRPLYLSIKDTFQGMKYTLCHSANAFLNLLIAETSLLRTKVASPRVEVPLYVS